MIRHALLTLTAASLLTAAGAAPAEAGRDHAPRVRYVDAGFRVGGLHFNVVHVDHRNRPDGFYLQVRQPLRSDHACNGFCYRDRGRSYHHRNCPAVRSHFEHFRPGLFAAMFGPPVWRDRHDRHRNRVTYRPSHGYAYGDDEYGDDEFDDRHRRTTKRYAVRRGY